MYIKRYKNKLLKYIKNSNDKLHNFLIHLIQLSYIIF